MAVSRDPAAGSPPGVSFEVERFAWADGRLEVTGRWYGIRGRRFLRPSLAVELPPPSGAPVKRTRKPRAAGQKLEARPPRAQALEAELAAARAEIEDLRGRLATEQRARERRMEQVETLREEGATARTEAEAERDEAMKA